jgi:hypothetical protein
MDERMYICLAAFTEADNDNTTILSWQEAPTVNVALRQGTVRPAYPIELRRSVADLVQ